MGSRPETLHERPLLARTVNLYLLDVRTLIPCRPQAPRGADPAQDILDVVDDSVGDRDACDGLRATTNNAEDEHPPEEHERCRTQPERGRVEGHHRRWEDPLARWVRHFAAYDWRRIHSATPQRNALTCRDGCAFLSGEGSLIGMARTWSTASNLRCSTAGQRWLRSKTPHGELVLMAGLVAGPALMAGLVAGPASLVDSVSRQTSSATCAGGPGRAR